ncbi:hypothetical protein AB0H58_16780 [Nocardia neocaledoniensis]
MTDGEQLARELAELGQDVADALAAVEPDDHHVTTTAVTPLRADRDRD